MHLQWLDDVLALLEEGNLSRAAQRRNITQPAFSRRIRGFEEWLGITVLERRANSIEISAALSSNEIEIRALVARLHELRTRLVQFDPASTTLTMAAQHASFYATYPDMALRAKVHLPGLRWRVRAGNLNDCVSLFLRGDASFLLCYEAENIGSLKFGSDIQRGIWGKDFLIPVVGGNLRHRVSASGEVPEDTPAIAYPEESYFGEVLNKNQRAFGTVSNCVNPFAIMAFSSGSREMVLKGLGIGWLPIGMIYRELESGAAISLASSYGMEPLEAAIYADMKAPMSDILMNLWSSRGDG
ncbi:LysR family transcriptional regulator [Pelagovum sp. HNIBRBA483]|uniref:LysR family transcriptional regulator n=1 Tax=Pelagovum sp. HNIBRBA483 TaxID=3233341 RepID=UPI0034A115E8